MNALLIAVCLLGPPNVNEGGPRDWRYPALSPGLSGSVTENETEFFAYFSQELDVAFQTVANYYSDRLKLQLREEYEKFANRDDDAPDSAIGAPSTIEIEGGMKRGTMLVYSFSPDHQHVTIHFADRESGDVFVLSIAGSERKTTVQFSRSPGE